MSQFENVTGFTEAFEVANTISDGMLAIGVPLVLWIALFGFTIGRNGRAHSITFASFVTGIILLLENMAGLVEYWIIIADLILLSLGIFMILHERRSIEV